MSSSSMNSTLPLKTRAPHTRKVSLEVKVTVKIRSGFLLPRESLETYWTRESDSDLFDDSDRMANTTSVTLWHK